MKFIPPGSLREEMHLSWSLDNVHRVVVRVDSTLLVWQRREGVVVHGKQTEAVPLRNVHDDSAWLKDDGCTPWSLERNYHVLQPEPCLLYTSMCIRDRERGSLPATFCSEQG